MNEIIKQQLKQCQVAHIPTFDDNTTYFIIKKYSEIQLFEHQYYFISLNQNLLNPNYNTLLVSNWNKGSVPKHKYYKCEVVKIMGQMIKINGLAFNIETNTDINEMWTGWLPIADIEVLQKL